MNTVGSYLCECSEVYIGDGFTCVGQFTSSYFASKSGDIYSVLSLHT